MLVTFHHCSKIPEKDLFWLRVSQASVNDQLASLLWVGSEDHNSIGESIWEKKLLTS
jgi:hypothetical protein